MVEEKELLEKEYYRRRLAQWRELGFDTRELEALLETDFEHFKTMSMEKLKHQLHLMSSEDAIPKPKPAQTERSAHKDGRLERPIITEFDDIRKQNQDEKEDGLLELRREMMRRKRTEDMGLRDLEEDSEFTPTKDRRAVPARDRPRPDDPKLEEDYPLISFRTPVDKRPSTGILKDKDPGPRSGSNKELTLLEEEAELIKRKRRLLEEEEERLRKKRRILSGSNPSGPKPILGDEPDEDAAEDEPALILVGKGRDDTKDEDEEPESEEAPPSDDEHVSLTVAHRATRTALDDDDEPDVLEATEEAVTVQEEEEEAPEKVVKKVPIVKKVRVVRPVARPKVRPVLRPAVRPVAQPSLKPAPRPVQKGPVKLPLKKVPPQMGKVQPSVKRPSRPGRSTKPLKPPKPLPRKPETHSPKPMAILGVLVLFFAILSVFYMVNPFPSLTVKATVSDPDVSLGEYVTFNGNGTKSNGKITSYSWDFGDKTTQAKGKVVKHIFGKAGAYNVTLTVKSDNGLIKSAKVSVHVSHLSIRPPAKKLGDVANYNVHGTGFVEGDSLYSIKNPYPQTGPAEIKIQNVSIVYNGTMVSSVRDIMAAEDGFNQNHSTLHREVIEDLKFDATAYSNLGNMPITVEGTESMKQQVYIDLKMNQTIKTVIVSTAQTKPIRIGSLIQLPALNSKDELRTYPDLATVDNQVNIEDLFVGKNLDTSDPSTLQGSIEKGQSPNAIVYTWKYDGISNIYKKPAIHLNVTVDSNTLSRLGMTSLYVDVWISNDIPTYVKMHTYFLGGNATMQYWADNTAELTSFTPGTVDITGTCTAKDHYLTVHPQGFYGEFNLTPPEGDPNQTSHLFSPHEALVIAADQSPGFKAYLSTGSPYAVSGNYSEKNGPAWNLTFGKKGSEEGYNIIVTDIGGGDYKVQVKQVTISAPEVSRDDLLSLITLSSAESIFRSDEMVRNEMFVGNNIDYSTTALLLDAETPYPNLDLTFTSISSTQIKYTYTLMKQVPAVGGQKVFSVGVNADNGQVMFVQEHTGNLPSIPFQLP